MATCTMYEEYRVWTLPRNMFALEQLFRSYGVRIVDITYSSTTARPIVYEVIMTEEDMLVIKLAMDCVILNHKDFETSLRTDAVLKAGLLV